METCIEYKNEAGKEMKILVTGANGYLGQGIVKHLLDNGHIVVATGRQTDLIDYRAQNVECDLFHIEYPYNFWESLISCCI